MLNGAGATGPARILVVDDNRLSARKLAMTVKALGHLAETAPDGAVALDLMRRRDFDVVLLDIVMPRMDGFEVLHALAADEGLRDLPVIVVSSLEKEAGNVARALELGAEDFLPKTYDPTILKARLNSTLAKKRFRDRELAYLRDVTSLTHAAEVIEAGNFRPSDLDISHVAARPDELGRLASVLEQMTHVIFERERLHDLRARTLWGLIMVILAGSLFASNPALGRIIATMEVQPLQTAIWANLMGAILCLGVSLYQNGLPRYGLAHVRFCLAWALVYGCAYRLWLIVVAGHVEASMIALVGSARAFIVFALAAGIALEKPSARRILGLGLGLAAVVIVLAAQGVFEGGADTGWLLAALALPALLSVHTLLMAWRPKDLEAFTATALMLAIAAALLAAVAMVSGQPIGLKDFDARLGFVLFCFGIASGIPIALALNIVARTGAVFASQMAYVQTFAGIAWGMILLDERLPPAAWGALILIVFGFLLVQPKQAGTEFSISIPMDGAKNAARGRSRGPDGQGPSRRARPR